MTMFHSYLLPQILLYKTISSKYCQYDCVHYFNDSCPCIVCFHCVYAIMIFCYVLHWNEGNWWWIKTVITGNKSIQLLTAAIWGWKMYCPVARLYQPPGDCILTAYAGRGIARAYGPDWAIVKGDENLHAQNSSTGINSLKIMTEKIHDNKPERCNKTSMCFSDISFWH